MTVAVIMRCRNLAGLNSDMDALCSMTWRDGVLRLLDQTRLPLQEEYIDCSDFQRVAEAIRRLEVRGAPAIGAAAAFGLVLGARSAVSQRHELTQRLPEIAAELKATRPTAVNLFWAIQRMMRVFETNRPHMTTAELLNRLETEAQAIAWEDQSANDRMAQWGASLFDKPTSVLTHCNAGALATVATGTALGVISQAWREGNIVEVYADETRPLLQGARLTAYELSRQGIPVTLITDNMAAWVMKTGKVQAVIVGADRITRNGDVANKIGTYGLAILAQAHHIPFYVAAPLSTFDFDMISGEDIPIEERNPDEVFHFAGVRTAPEGIRAFNPAFDVTPARYITAIVTEAGVVRQPSMESIKLLKNQN